MLFVLYLINNIVRLKHDKKQNNTREKLLSDVWGYDYFGADRTVDTHIKMLRNNLGKYKHLISTVRSIRILQFRNVLKKFTYLSQ